MAVAVLDPFMADVRPDGIQRGRGGFMRSANDTPWVSDPAGGVVASGPRKGEIRRLMYGQPSNRGMLIENSTNLTKWGERRCVYGIGRDPDLIEACRALSELEIDSDEYKVAADAVIIAAKAAAKAHLAADRGTHVHLLTEDFDDGRDWVLRAEAGELVDLDRATQDALVAGWHRMLAEHSLQILAVEASCVDDTWHLAGTLDRVMRCGKALRFAKVSGEVVEIPAGTVLVGDVKTSAKRLDRKQAYSIQIASYAQSVPYDTEAETRGEWPWPISQTHALILHPDIDTCEWELIYVDLTLGREHGGRCVVDAKSWEARTDIFSVAQLHAPQPSPTPVAVTAAPEACVASGAEPSGAAPFIDPTVNDLLPRNGMPRHALDELEVDQLNDARRASYADWTLSPGRARATLATDPGQGAAVDEVTFAAVKGHYGRLDPAGKAWLATLIGQAKRRGVGFHAREMRTVRVFELYRALIALAASGNPDDEMLRALLAPILGDIAFFAGLEVGHIVGSLDWRQATRLAQLVDAMNVL